MPRKKEPKTEDRDANLDKQRQELIVKAKKEGHVAQRDILALYPDTPENAEALDGLYTDLADANIEIVTSEAEEVGFTDEWAAEDTDEEITNTTAVYLDDDI